MTNDQLRSTLKLLYGFNRNVVIERNNLTQVQLRQLGLSDDAGTLTLHVPAVNSGEGSFATIASKEDVRTVTCPVVVGDEALSDVTPAFIKIDVEGFELHVLKGLAKLINRSKAPISIEFNAEALEAAGASAVELHSYLVSLGYRGFRTEGAGRAKGLRLRLVPLNLSKRNTFDALYLHESEPRSLPEILRRTAPY